MYKDSLVKYLCDIHPIKFEIRNEFQLSLALSFILFQNEYYRSHGIGPEDYSLPS